MRREFPVPPEDGELPTQGTDDELLDAVPEGDDHIGSLDGYKSGSRIRAIIFGLLTVGVIGAIFAARWYMNYLEENRHHDAPVYEVDPALMDQLTRELHWDNGTGRFGLSREPPGVEAIILPDRVLRLADGHDHAQVKVTVKDGRTQDIKVLVGRIVQHPRTQ